MGKKTGIAVLAEGGGLPRSAARIVAAYAALGLLWIWMSDLVFIGSADSDAFWRSGLKGSGYVAVTAAVLYLFLRSNDERIARYVSDLAAAQEEARDLYVRLDILSDELRRRLAGQIHDGPLQDLVAVSMRMELLARSSNEGREPSRADLTAAAGSAKVAIDSLRSALAGIHSIPVGQAHDIEPALRSFARSVDPEMTLEVSASRCEEIPPGHCQVVFRVLCEAIRNSHKHGGAKNMNVSAEVHNRKLLISVTDDGTGFDPETDPGPDHFGMRMMRDRIGMLGGVLVVRSGSAGTRLEASVPL